MDAAILQLFDEKKEVSQLIPDFEIKVSPGSYEEVSERFKTYLRFRFGIDPASVFITGATGSGKSTTSISLAIQYVKQGIPVLAIDINQTMSPEHICKALSPEFESLVIRHNLYREAVASDLITPKIYDGYIEDSYDTAYGLSEIISKGYRLGPTQAAILTDAIKSRVDCRETSLRIFPSILEELESSSLASARTLANRLRPLLRNNVFECRKIGSTSLPLSPNIHVFDLSGYPAGIRVTPRTPPGILMPAFVTAQVSTRIS